MKLSDSKNTQRFLIILILCLLIGFNIYLLYPFFISIVMGGVLAFALNSVVRAIEKIGLGKISTLNVILLSSILLLFIPTFSFFVRGATLVTQLINDHEKNEQIKLLQQKVVQWIEQLAPQFGYQNFSVQDFFNQSIDQIIGFLVQILTKTLSEIPHIAMFSIIMIASAYWFLFKEKEIKIFFENHLKMKSDRRQKLVLILQNICRDILLANILTAFIQACIVTVGSLIFGFQEWFLIFFITFIASFIPLVGAGPVALSLSLIQFANHEIGYGIGLIMITIFAGISDNIIRSYITSSGEVKIPVLFSILSVIGGVLVFGLPGLFLGPLLIALLIGILPILIQELLNQD